MKAKNVNSVISKKFNEFLESIEDVNVKEEVKNNSIITGGCIASLLLNEQVNDFDIYFTNKKTVLAVANYYVSLFNKNNPSSGTQLHNDGYVLDGEKLEEIKKNGNQFGGVEMISNMTPDRVKICFHSRGHAVEDNINIEDEENSMEYMINYLKEDKKDKKDKKPYRPIFISANAITLANDIQLCIRFYGNAEKIHENFDYVHCTNYWTSYNKQLILNQKALESILSRDLFYIGSKYPLSSVIRTRKFFKRGWMMNAGQYLKMLFQVSELDLSSPEVLEDQLTGVDLVYFGVLIQALKEAQKTAKDKNENFAIDKNYLTQIIDRIF